MEEEEPTMNEAGLQRSWPSASIETGAEEDQRVVINHCICCNKDMGSDSDHLVCEACCERIEFGSTAVQINRDCPMWRRSDAAVGGDHAPKGR